MCSTRWSECRWNDISLIHRHLEAWKAKRGFCYPVSLLYSMAQWWEDRWEEMRRDDGGRRKGEGEKGDVHNAIITSFVLLCQFCLQVQRRKKGKIIVSGKQFIPALEASRAVFPLYSVQSRLVSVELTHQSLSHRNMDLFIVICLWQLDAHAPRNRTDVHRCKCM